MNDLLFSKDLPNGVEQIIAIERFFQEVYSFAKNAVISYYVFRISRDVQYMHGRLDI
jgi:hypothetical protein